MSYTPTEWESTDVVTATRMNALETAVGDMNMSYTPNTWSDGDILSAEKMNALEQAVASGGGGSSDFSTAEVTITTTGESGVSPALILCAITEVDGYTGIDTFITDGGGETFTVPLYKGACSWGFFYPDGAPPATVVVTGDIAYDDEEAIVTITGDGTITIS